MNTTFLILEIISIISFAISGAIVGINKKMDIFGVTILGLTTATGGGIIRDLILGYTPPVSFQNPRNALIAIITSLIIFIPFIRKKIVHDVDAHSRLILITDSIGLGIFTVMGVNSAFNYSNNPNMFLCVFLGVVTGVGGGVIRDILSCDKPYIFVKHFYASASLIGAIICVILFNYVNSLTAMIISSIIIVTLRFLAAHYKWNLPRA